MVRTVLLYLLPATLVATAWLRLEEPRRGGYQAVLLMGLALAPALARPAWLRAPALVAAALVGLNVAFERDLPGGLPAAGQDGLLGFYDVTLPFDPAPRPLMHGLIMLAVFSSCLVLALAIATRRPIPAVAALVVGVGWPATLRPSGSVRELGALLLATALLLLLGTRPRPARALRPALGIGVACLVAALAASSSPAVAKEAFIGWKDWDPYTRTKPVSVQYVWDSNYDGIRFPKKRTTVLTVKAPDRPLYWRATTLDAFTGYGWTERLTFTVARLDQGRDDLSLDPFMPARVRLARLVEQEITVEKLRDRHLPGGGTPVAYDPAALRPAAYAEGGVAFAGRALAEGDRYRVWSYVPRPTPEQLARTRPLYPWRVTDPGRFLDVAPAATVPPFGRPERETVVAELFTDRPYDEKLHPYAPLYAAARTVVGRPRHPYAATVALESWFRSAGGFTYDEQPPKPAPGVPALVDFVTRTKAGYCQHYAGAMALMLRYLGIPARVAAGFTSGIYDEDKGSWTVSDRNAHTWVEVWFRGYGWLPFDPTPGRGALSGTYTVASRGFDSPGAARVAEGLAAASILALKELAQSGGRAADGEDAAPAEPADRQLVSTPTGRRNPARMLTLLVAALIAGIAVAKTAVRRRRYLTRDPRSIATACRSELLDFLRDQRIELPRGATLAELSAALESRLAVSADRFAAAANAARFGSPRAAAQSAHRTRRELALLRRQLRRRLSRFQRLRGFLSLRSLRFAR